MADANLQQVFTDLYRWCSDQDFAGYDPFDALNSKLFQATPLKKSRFARLAWTQLLKRSPVNLRPISCVPREKNAKGIALFALATLANYRRTKSNEAKENARGLLSELLAMKLPNWHGAAWGYNFDWQSRVLFAPRGTPTIVATSFAARALIEASQVFPEDVYLDTASTVCEFIVRDLKRSVDTDKELCFGYSPTSATSVFNASLLAAETLAAVASLRDEPTFAQLAVRATRYVVNQQRSDGSWTYGADATQLWVDSFHTAFLLSSIIRIIRFLGAEAQEFEPALRRGYDFWRERFFLADGWPKYYDDSPFPVDVHAAATAIATLSDLNEFDPAALPLAERVASWSIEHLRDSRGFFYYQKRRFYTVRTPFMRWSEAWMLYALSRLLEEQSK